MGRPKSIARLRRLVEEQEGKVTSILLRLVEAEEALADTEPDSDRYGLAGRLVGARRGQVENAEGKLERLKDELAAEVERRTARDRLMGTP